MGHLLAALDTKPNLEAWVPKIAFPSIEAAAVDALNYTDLRTSSAHDTERMRRSARYFKLDKFHRISAGLTVISAK